jgi:leader peptidase (prepilin peptidase)/N-methyltransferase
MESAATRLLATVASGVLGLAIGSFLNVVVYRLPRAMSVSRPPSHCPACDTELGALDNIPVLSWLALRGRCRHCGVPISPRYPVIELATGLLFAGLALALGSVEPIAPLAGVVATTVAIVAIDLDDHDVPRMLGWIALFSSATLIAVSVADNSSGRLGWAGIGAGAAVVAWALNRAVGRSGTAAIVFPGIASCAAWGWAAGWAGEGGGLAIGIGLALVALLGPLLRKASRRGVVAAAGTLSIVTIVAGAIASR